jgi:hypothetical protein
MQRTARRTTRLGRVTFAALALVSMQGFSGTAHAHGAGGAQLPPDAPAVTPDGEKAKAALATASKDAAAASSVKEGKRALGRAHGASLAGDTEGARLLSRLALAWAEAATSAMKAEASESHATEEETRAHDLDEKLSRAKLTLRETESRKGQLVAEVARVEAEAKKTNDAGLEKEKKRVNGGKAKDQGAAPQKQDGGAKKSTGGKAKNP